MSTLIGLGGKLRAGKDEVASHLATVHGYSPMGMSDALNEALLALNPYIPTGNHTIEDQYGYEVTTPRMERYRALHDRVGYVEAKLNPEVRRLLQALGTEVGRDMIDQDVWVTIAERRIRGMLEAGQNVVITAVRFPNELEMIQRLGGTSVWIERASEARGASEAQSAHASETSVSAEDFRWTIDNVGTLPELFEKVDALQAWITAEPPTRYPTNTWWPSYDR